MASDLNKVEIEGRLGTDPEIRFFSNGNPIVELRIANNEHWRRDESQDWNEKTNWVPVAVYGKAAREIVESEDLSKGDRVKIAGSLESRSFETENGKRSILRVSARQIELLQKAGQKNEVDGDSRQQKSASAPRMG